MASMRVETGQAIHRGTPGSTVEVTIDVVNSGELIDGVSTRLIGLPEATVTAEPELLPLFPGATGQVTLAIALPSSQRAGRHSVSVEVNSAVTGTPTAYVDLEIDVDPHPSIRLTRDTTMVRSRRRARFVLAVENDGNVPLEATLTATSPERVTTTFTPSTVTVEPGAAVAVLATVTGPRMFTGSEVDRPVAVGVVARPRDTSTDAPESSIELVDTAALTLKQRPLISRGFLTFLILASIVAIWAAIFLFGLSQVFKTDPLTKTAPLSFYTSETEGGPEPDGSGAPAGSTPKTGLLAPGVGGSIEGVVTAVSNNAPVGRITVTAWRMGRDGPVKVSSAATQADGSYSLAGLFPTTYWLQYTAPGYDTVWHPSKPDGAPSPVSKQSPATKASAEFESSAGPLLRTATTPGIKVGAQAKKAGTHVVVTGKNAQISGRVDSGSAETVPPTTVTATMIDGGDPTTPTATVTTDSEGNYRLTNLPSPGTYQLAFAAEGYDVTTQVEAVGGGENRLQPTIQLGSRDGTVAGTVFEDSKSGQALGGVTVTATVAGTPVSVITPTVGAVGSFMFNNLPTPGTYLLTFSSPDHGTTVRIVELEPGGSSVADAVMTAGTGSISGMLLDADGKGVGGAKVTVGGSAGEVPASTTLTAGAVGSFTIAGLASPGTYTLTFEHEGAAPVTIPVTLSGDAPLSNVTATMAIEQVQLYGLTVDGNNRVIAGASITITDGGQSWSTTSTSGGSGLPRAIRNRGGYVFPALPQGTYALTIKAPGFAQQTTRVELGSAGERRVDLSLTSVGP